MSDNQNGFCTTTFEQLWQLVHQHMCSESNENQFQESKNYLFENEHFYVRHRDNNLDNKDLVNWTQTGIVEIGASAAAGSRGALNIDSSINDVGGGIVAGQEELIGISGSGAAYSIVGLLSHGREMANLAVCREC